MIYFVRADGAEPIKIGYTQNLNKRLAGLQTANPSTLEVLAVIDGDRKYEKSLHEQFEQYHIRGEWFHPGPELVAFIKYIKHPSKNIIYKVDNGDYRIIFVRPIKITFHFILTFGAYDIKILGDAETANAFGFEGKVAVLETMLKELGTNDLALTEFREAVAD